MTFPRCRPLAACQALVCKPCAAKAIATDSKSGVPGSCWALAMVRSKRGAAPGGSRHSQRVRCPPLKVGHRWVPTPSTLLICRATLVCHCRPLAALQALPLDYRGVVCGAAPAQHMICIVSPPNTGGDLASVGVDAVPAAWLNVENAKRKLMAIGIAADEIDVLEVYAGSGNWTNACQAAGLRAGPCVDSMGAVPWDMLQAQWRCALWAIMVVCLPSWVHSGFPCTFWSHFTHLRRKASTSELEEDRTSALVHVIVTLQLAAWQHLHKRHVSFENPPKCASWRLDVVERTLAAIGAKKYFFDSCVWDHTDPVSKKPINKQQCVASTADLSGLCRRCACHAGRGRCPRGIHEVVQGEIIFPSGARVRRSVWSAAYPADLCNAWAQIVKECVLAIGN